MPFIFAVMEGKGKMERKSGSHAMTFFTPLFRTHENTLEGGLKYLILELITNDLN